MKKRQKMKLLGLQQADDNSTSKVTDTFTWQLPVAGVITRMTIIYETSQTWTNTKRFFAARLQKMDGNPQMTATANVTGLPYGVLNADDKRASLVYPSNMFTTWMDDLAVGMVGMREATVYLPVQQNEEINVLLIHGAIGAGTDAAGITDFMVELEMEVY